MNARQRRLARRLAERIAAREAVAVPGPGHFIGADCCRFVLHHHVGHLCVSTVGDYRPPSEPGGTIVGHRRTHETMLFNTRCGRGRWVEMCMIPANSDAEARDAHALGLLIAATPIAVARVIARTR